MVTRTSVQKNGRETTDLVRSLEAKAMHEPEKGLIFAVRCAQPKDKE